MPPNEIAASIKLQTKSSGTQQVKSLHLTTDAWNCIIFFYLFRHAAIERRQVLQTSLLQNMLNLPLKLLVLSYKHFNTHAQCLCLCHTDHDLPIQSRHFFTLVMLLII